MLPVQSCPKPLGLHLLPNVEWATLRALTGVAATVCLGLAAYVLSHWTHFQTHGASSPRQWNQRTAHQPESTGDSLLPSLSHCGQMSQACQHCMWHQETTTRFSEHPGDHLVHISEGSNTLPSTPKLNFQMICTKSHCPSPPCPRS